jgi:hypothetical protein
MAQYWYESSDSGFVDMEMPGKGRNLEWVRELFAEYKKLKGDSTITLFRTTKRTPILWTDWLPNERWSVPYRKRTVNLEANLPNWRQDLAQKKVPPPIATTKDDTKNNFPLPDGWRFPTSNELSDDSLRNDSPFKYSKAIADFNGDGINDEAYLLKSKKYSGEGLFVRLSVSKKGYEWIMLDTIDRGKE